MSEDSLYLTKELMEKLKAPLGILLKGNYKSTLYEMIENEKPEKLISVGDFTSNRIQEYGITPNMIVVDNKTERKEMKPVSFPAKKVYDVKNPAGTLSREARKTMTEAMKNDGYTRINVDGEEDLMTLLAVNEAPLGSAVLYGQPKEGVVVIKVTEDKKKEIRNLLNEMSKDRV